MGRIFVCNRCEGDLKVKSLETDNCIYSVNPETGELTFEDSFVCQVKREFVYCPSCDNGISSGEGIDVVQDDSELKSFFTSHIMNGLSMPRVVTIDDKPDM